MRKVADQVPVSESLFRFGLPAPAWTMTDVVAKPSLQNCDPKVKADAEVECATLKFDKQDECILYACAAALAADGADDRPTVSTHSLPFGCHFVGDGLWSDQESVWCCHHKGLGCSRNSTDEFSKRDEMSFKKLYSSHEAAQPSPFFFATLNAQVCLVATLVCLSFALILTFAWRHLRNPRSGARRILVSNMDLADFLE